MAGGHHELVGPAENEPQRERDLAEHGREMGMPPLHQVEAGLPELAAVGGGGVEERRGDPEEVEHQRLVLLSLGRFPQVEIDIVEVADEQQPRDQASAPMPHRGEADEERAGVEWQKEAEIAAGHHAVDRQARPILAALAVDDGGEGGDAEGERGEHERRAQDGAQRDVVARRLAEEDQRHQRDQRLRQGGPDRREHASHRPLREAEPHSQPFHAISEQLRADDDDEEAA